LAPFSDPPNGDGVLRRHKDRLRTENWPAVLYREVLSVGNDGHELKEDGKSGPGDPCGTASKFRDYPARTGLPQSTIGYLPLTK
jgi:hypothetical protein